MTAKSKDPSIPRLSNTNKNKTYSVLGKLNESFINRAACSGTTIQDIGDPQWKASALD